MCHFHVHKTTNQKLSKLSVDHADWLVGTRLLNSRNSRPSETMPTNSVATIIFLVADIWSDISRRSCLLTKRRYCFLNVRYSRPNEIMPSNCYSATGYVWERVDGLGSAPPHSRGWGHSRHVFFLRLYGMVVANCNVFCLSFLTKKT